MALRRWVPYTLLVAACVLSFEAAAYVSATAEARRHADFQADADETRHQIEVRLNTYIEVVRAGTALLAASNEIHHSEFRAFVRRLELRNRYPGIELIGFAQRVPDADLRSFVQAAKLDGVSLLRVHPNQPRTEHHPVVFFEPVDERNARAIGLDLAIDPVQRAAMDRARDTGQPALSGRSAPGSPLDEIAPGSVMLYVPVYRQGAAVESIDDRRQALHGFAFSPLRPEVLLQGIAASAVRPVTFDVHDMAEPEGQGLIHSSASGTPRPAYETTARLAVAGREWDVHLKSTRPAQRFLSPGGENTLAAGLLLALMLFVITRAQIGAWETAARHSSELTASEQALRASEAQLREMVVREQQARAEAQAADRAKDDFLVALSHELRTPLNAVLGWLTMLKRGTVREDRRGHALEVIERNARLQAQLVEDLLDVSRILLGKMTLNLQPLALPSIVASVIDSLRPAAEAAAIELAAPRVSGAGVVDGDQARISQVVWNLLSNAVKFTPAGGRVSVEVVDEHGWVELRVRDTGIGIAPEFLPHVFERFRQADASSTRTHSGLGLGLAITRHLVDMHRGSIEAHSDGRGEGALFVVRLPVSAQASQVTDAAPAQAGAQALADVRVLVVDDDDDTRDLLCEALGSSGAQVVAVESAGEAMEQLNQAGADVLVSDIRMPGEDGISLLRRVRALPGCAGKIPAIALTAYARDYDRIQAMEAGFQLHLSKPIELGQLQAGVARLAAQGASERCRGAGSRPEPS